MTPAELKSLRMRSEMTMTELAKRLGVSISLVSIWERGKAPIPPDRLKEIKKVCGKESPDEFRDLEQERWRNEAYASSLTKSSPRTPQTVELGPETMKALKDLINEAIVALKETQLTPESLKNISYALRGISITPEVIQASKEGDRYRAKTQEILGRGW